MDKIIGITNAPDDVIAALLSETPISVLAHGKYVGGHIVIYEDSQQIASGDLIDGQDVGGTGTYAYSLTPIEGYSGYDNAKSYRLVIGGDEINFVRNGALTNLPLDAMYIIADSGRGMQVTQTYPDLSSVSVSQTKTVTTKKYQAKKLDKSLLPDGVESGIEAATTKAATALSAAQAAQDTANTAISSANTAQTTANQAQTKAETAQTTADNCVKYSGSQALTDAQKKQARDNIGAGTSSFNGSYNSLNDKPTLSKVATGGSYNDLDDRPCYEDRTYSQLFSPIPRPSILSGSVYIGKKTTGYPSINEGVLYAIEYGGEYTDPCICKNISFSTSTGLENKYIGNLALYADVDESDRFSTDTDAYIGDLTSYDTGENWLYIVKQTTSWSMFVAAKEDQFGVYLYKVTENVKQLSNALIPDTIQRVGEAVILKSSTSGSTKKFKLTVNDTGTLSATEVTDA